MMESTRLFDSLPQHLAERIRVLRDALHADGEFILYWMHHAARGHENPALDAAVYAANERDLPVLVYQGLAGRHRFNSDRHHRFIMEGGRDVARELADRNIRYVFHTPTDPTAPSPLRSLAERAALLVVEEFPAPPFPKWVDALLTRCDCPAWSVDAACVVPMRSVGSAHDRAFKFRNAIKKDLKARIARHYTEAEPAAPAFDSELGFEPIKLDAVDLDDLCARCDIDHTLGPVAHTPGGSDAGYQRWNAFKDSGLRSYAKRRNNAAIDGVSRLSPYLHHGHVSPFRIAREAWNAGGDGAEKFVDELVYWRELAHNFAFHYADEIESLSVLPDWARDTLMKHADDERDAIYSWETLARARTGDRLWDAAQRSLLCQGELHNNLRMTWAKAIVGWTNGPSDALRILIDLNHRFALDGNDPNSYGGLLWALGALDRPFKPEQPVLGVVRGRDTATHLRRLDIEKYEQRVAGPAEGEPRRIAIVGCGLAGAAAARALADQGHHVRGFDKARGPGGRMSTRRTDTASYDHGAVYFTARDPRFGRLVQSWRHDGVAAEWRGRFASFDDDRLEPSDGTNRFVGVPGMNAIVEHIAEDVQISWGARVTHVERRGEEWFVHTGDREKPAAHEHGPFDELIVATPAAQAKALLEHLGSPVVARLDGVQYTPTLTAMITLPSPIDLGADAIQFKDHDVLGYAAYNASKPRRDDDTPTWVVHANHAWSAEHLEDDNDASAATLFNAFCDTFDIEVGEPIELTGQRWRYAFVSQSLGDGATRDDDRALTLCGDWQLGPRCEYAYLSGAAAAGRVLAAAARRPVLV